VCHANLPRARRSSAPSLLLPLPLPPPAPLNFIARVLPPGVSRVAAGCHGRFLSKYYRSAIGRSAFPLYRDGSPIPRRESMVEPPTALISLARNIVMARRVCPDPRRRRQGEWGANRRARNPGNPGRIKLARYAIAVFARILIYIPVCINARIFLFSHSLLSHFIFPRDYDYERRQLALGRLLCRAPFYNRRNDLGEQREGRTRRAERAGREEGRIFP